jgi:predicted patatin/cPLA2 family phospholipase
MRGIFTAGVLDNFLGKNIIFPYVIGVSAGASNGISYISKQKGRSYFSNVKLPKIRPYVGIKSLLKGRGFFDLDFLFYEYPDKYYPFDWDAYFNSGQRYVMVVSNCITGKAEYIEEYKDGDRLLAACKASCTLPFTNPVSYLDGKPMLDGGVCDAVPIKYLMEQGFEKFVIVLTRPKGYRKKEKKVWLPFFVYSKYPKIREALRGRAARYNQAMDIIDELEAQGKAIVIRPKAPMTVSRSEVDTQKLDALYREGLEYEL